MKRNFLGILSVFVLSLSAYAQSPSEHLRYDLPPEQVTTLCQESLDRAKEGYKAIVDIPDAERTFPNTVQAFDHVGWDMNDESASPQFLKYVSTDKAVRKAGHECEILLEDFSVDIYSREDLYEALKSYGDKGEALEGEDKKLLEKTLLAYKRNGFGLPVETRAKIKKLNKELVQIELEFGKNLNEVNDFLAVTAEELEGLPQDFIDNREKLPDGRFKVTLDYPDYLPFMRNAKDPRARQALESLYSDRAVTTNVVLLKKVLRIRRRIAGLMGYADHASFVQEDRMAKNPDNVREFLDALKGRLRQKAEAELQVLLDLKREEEGGKADRIFNWDFAYYHNKLKKTKYAVDDEEVKKYFPLDAVTQGMFTIYQKLLGVRFEEVTPSGAWHPDVKLFSLSDSESGELRGHFYMDLFPREGKYKHAAAFTLIKGRELASGSYQKPVSAVVANFTKPTETAPSLLKHGEVETYFHEFGHIMHQILTRARHGRLSGTSVARDFVEAPSQMLENWVWNRHMLKAISAHYQDRDKKLPTKLIKRMIEAKNLNAGLRYSRQLFYASIDLAYHSLPAVTEEGSKKEEEEPLDTTALYSRLKDEIALVPMSPGTHPESSFGHLMGYDAAYYGYLWSEVYAADMYSLFEKEGVLNPELGRRYRELILEPGRSLDEAGQLKKFLGREPNQDAFFKSIGLTESEDEG